MFVLPGCQRLIFFIFSQPVQLSTHIIRFRIYCNNYPGLGRKLCCILFFHVDNVDRNMQQHILERVKDATVAMAILNDDDPKKPFTIVGSGFCIHSRGIVVTCEHVLRAFLTKPSQGRIAEVTKQKPGGPKTQFDVYTAIPHAIFYNSKQFSDKLLMFPVRVDISMSKTNFDLGMIRLHVHKAFKDGFPFIEIGDYSDVYEGMEVWTCGFPLGNYMYEQLGTVTSSFTKGIISSIIPTPGVAQEHLGGFQLNLTATHGNSGGPVFSPETGKVFGVLQRGVRGHNGSLLQGITKAEPIYPIFEHGSLTSMLEAPVGKIPDRD